jgi:hypothetical protein
MTGAVVPLPGELPDIVPSTDHYRRPEEWPEPDPSFLRHGRRPAPELPGERIFGGWDAWIRDAAEMAGVPRDYVACPLLVAMATLIGNARAVSPWSGWSEPSIIWGGVVGDPSAGKSPGADPVLTALHEVQRDLARDIDQERLDWESTATAAKAAKDVWQESVRKAVKAGDEPPRMPASAVVPDEPQPPRIITSDVTPEKLGALLKANPKGLLNTRDELSGWLQGFDRYSKGGERSFWLEAYGARPYTIDRVKAGGSLHIDRLSISVFGGVQPDRLSSLLLNSDDDGLTARFMWFWPDPLPPTRPQKHASTTFVYNAFARLAALEGSSTEESHTPFVLTLTPEAADEFEEWRLDHHRRSGGVSGMLLSAFGKMPGLLLRLALTLELGAWATKPDGTPEPTDVSRRTIIRAIGFIEDYIKPMSERVYGDAATPANERKAMTLARWLAHSGDSMLNLREVKRTGSLPGLRAMPDIQSAVAVLVEAGWLRADGFETGGRPRKDYRVNPMVPILLKRDRDGNRC